MSLSPNGHMTPPLPPPPEEAPDPSGLRVPGATGAVPRAQLPAPGGRHQHRGPGGLQPRGGVQDLPAWLPWSALRCQDHQGIPLKSNVPQWKRLAAVRVLFRALNAALFSKAFGQSPSNLDHC